MVEYQIISTKLHATLYCPFDICSLSSILYYSGFFFLFQVNIDKGPQSRNCSLAMVGKSHEPIRGNRSSSCASPQTCKASRYSVLMDNLNVLEETFVDSDVLRLEREILLQLGRLGVLNLFNIFLSHKPSNIFDLSDVAANSVECNMNGLVDSEKDKIIVSSRKKKQRRKRREKALETTTISMQLPPTNTLHGRYQKPKHSSPKRMSDSRKRSAVARNEVEMSKGVKVVLQV